MAYQLHFFGKNRSVATKLRHPRQREDAEDLQIHRIEITSFLLFYNQ
ncbi:MAG: hypothetical protein K2W99_06130 [Chthoniobacterales bacterium]|nr:hypothetical protein [Chthoniobacterales bacterium]